MRAWTRQKTGVGGDGNLALWHLRELDRMVGPLFPGSAILGSELRLHEASVFPNMNGDNTYCVKYREREAETEKTPCLPNSWLRHKKQ